MKTLNGHRGAGGPLVCPRRRWRGPDGASAWHRGNATVWERFIAHLEVHGHYRWLAPDLRGHGRSTMEGPYGFAQHAADIAGLLASEDPSRVVILGHSFGGVIAAHLGSGQYRFTPSRIVTHSVKLEWTDVEIAKFHEIAGKPAHFRHAR